jgi:hypothetical protein
MSSLSRRDIVRRLSAQTSVPEPAPIPHYSFLDGYRVSVQQFPDGCHLVWMEKQHHMMRRMTRMQIAETIPGAAAHEVFARHKITATLPSVCPTSTAVPSSSWTPCGTQPVLVDDNGICVSPQDQHAVTPTTFHSSSGCKRRAEH